LTVLSLNVNYTCVVVEYAIYLHLHSLISYCFR